jgi:hypothetical protein
MADTLRNLVIWIDSKFNPKGLDEAEKKAKKSKISFTELSSAIGLIKGGIETAAAAVSSLVMPLAELGGWVDDTSQKVGISATSLQELRFAAEQNGVAQDELAQSLVRLSKGYTEAAAKGSGPFIDGLKQIGLKFDDVKGKKPDELFEIIADRLKDIRDPAIKAGLAQEFFGKSGANLIPLINKGSEGIAALRQEAQELGFVLSDESVAAADEFGDQLDVLKNTFGGIRNELGAKLLPVLNDMIRSTLNWIKENKGLIGQKLDTYFSHIAKAFQFFQSVYIRFEPQFKSLVDLFGRLADIVFKILPGFDAITKFFTDSTFANVLEGTFTKVLGLADKFLGKVDDILRKRDVLVGQAEGKDFGIQGEYSEYMTPEEELKAQQNGVKFFKGINDSVRKAAEQELLKDGAKVAKERLKKVAKEDLQKLLDSTSQVMLSDLIKSEFQRRQKEERIQNGRLFGSLKPKGEKKNTGSSDEEIMELLEKSVGGDSGARRKLSQKDLPKFDPSIAVQIANTNVYQTIDARVMVQGHGAEAATVLADRITEKRGGVFELKMREALEYFTPVVVR